MYLETQATTTGLTNQANMQAKVDRIVQNALDLGVYIIIDWHTEQAVTEVAESVAFFTARAKKYGNYPIHSTSMLARTGKNSVTRRIMRLPTVNGAAQHQWCRLEARAMHGFKLHSSVNSVCGRPLDGRHPLERRIRHTSYGWGSRWRAWLVRCQLDSTIVAYS